jgi:hypothetical protein
LIRALREVEYAETAVSEGDVDGRRVGSIGAMPPAMASGTAVPECLAPLIERGVVDGGMEPHDTQNAAHR